MLVDTGAPSTYLHPITVQKFLQEGSDIPSSFPIFLGDTEIKAQLNPTSDESNVTAYLNILGMDFLDEAVPELIPFLSDKFQSIASATISPVWVKCGDNTAFKVSPASNDIDSLKKAIKAEWDAATPSNPLNHLTLTIFDWDAAANAAKKDAVSKQSTPLHANTEDTPYTFKV